MRPALPRALLTTPLAHRGLHDRERGVVENARAAFEAAIEAGYGIELDLQLSADGEAMVFHDDALARLTGRTGMVRDLTARELGGVGLAGGDETIPTLTEILDLVAGRAPLLIEAKDQSLELAPVDGRLERRAARLLAAYEGDIAVMSFNPHSVAAFAAEAPNIPRGRTTCAFDERTWRAAPPERLADLRRLDDLDALGAGFISHQLDDLASDQAAAVKAAGIPVLCWTIRSEAAEAAARAVADNITFEGYRATLPGSPDA